MMYWVFKGLLKPPIRGAWRVRPEGLERVPKDGPAIIAANHLSFLDSFFIPICVKRRKVTYLAKADYFKSWKTSWFFRAVGQIPVERDDRKKSQAALDVGLELLSEGRLLGIYPEGTRSPDGRLFRGRTGVARLALRSGAPVIPCGVIGSQGVLPKSAKLPRLRGPEGRIKVQVKFGEPLDFSRYRDQESDRFVLRSVTDEIMYEIMQLSGQRYANQYASRAATLPLPESTKPIVEEDVDISDEAIAG
jgi:1-acyl-sn-glycerol-3-phosphate acyltransferase